jgi:hypothetical protein
MKLNLPTEISKTLTSAASTSTVNPTTPTKASNPSSPDNERYTSFFDSVLANRPLFPGNGEDLITTTTTTTAASPTTVKATTLSNSISNIEEWYMRYMSKILESTTNDPPSPTPPTDFSTTSITTSAPSKPVVPLNLFEENLTEEFKRPPKPPNPPKDTGIRNELQEILSSLPGSGIITSSAPAASMMTCPSTCTCSCPATNIPLADQDQNPTQPDKTGSDKNVQMASIVLEQVDPNDSGSNKKVNLDISLVPCARTATYQLNLALKLCRK